MVWVVLIPILFRETMEDVLFSGFPRVIHPKLTMKGKVFVSLSRIVIRSKVNAFR
jgi:hypothetical protein